MSISPDLLSRLKAKLEPLRNRLVDLSLRNRMLNFRDGGSQSLPLRPVDLSELYQVLVREGSQVDVRGTPVDTSETDDEDTVTSLKPAFDESGEDATNDLGRGTLRATLPSADCEQRMNSLYRKYKECQQSFGANLCYVAIGFLEWNDPKREQEEMHYSPLLLLPVALSRTLRPIQWEEDEQGGSRRRGQARNAVGQSYAFTISHDGEDLIENIALKLKLESLPQAVQLPQFDDSLEAEDLEVYLENVELSLRTIPKDSKMRWRLVRSARIAFFNSVKEAMYRDLDPDNWPENGLFEKEWVAAALEGRETPVSSEVNSRDIVNAMHIEPIPTLLDADGSQMKALVRTKRGESVVIQGPPGTGKSQTIANLITAALQQNRSVLFMSEKLAALTVVRRNLERAKLGAYCLELHSAKATAKAVLKQVEERLGHQPSVADNLMMRKAARTNAEAHRVELENYGEALLRQHKKLQMPLSEVIWEYSRAKDEIAPLTKQFGSENIPSLFEGKDSGIVERDWAVNAMVQASQLLDSKIVERAKPYHGTCCHVFPDEVYLESFKAALGSAIGDVAFWKTCESSMPESQNWPSFRGTDWCELLEQLPDSEVPELPDVMLRAARNDLASVSSYKSYVDSVRAWREPCREESRTLSERRSISRAQLVEAMEAAARLGTSPITRLGNTTILGVRQAYEQVAWLKESLEARIQFANELSQLLHCDVSMAFAEGLKTASLWAAVLSLSPASWRALTEGLVHPAIDQMIEAAHARCAELAAQQVALDSQASLARLPDNASLLEVCRKVTASKSSFLKWIPGSDARKTRKVLKSYFRDSASLPEAAMVGHLESVVEWRNNAKSFADREPARELLQDAFLGLETDWRAIQDSRRSARELVVMYGVAKTKGILGAKDRYQQDAASILDLCQDIQQYVDEFLVVASEVLSQPSELLKGISLETMLHQVCVLCDQFERDTAALENLGLPQDIEISISSEVCSEALSLRSFADRAAELTADPNFLGDLDKGLFTSDIQFISAAADWLGVVEDVEMIPQGVKLWLLEENLEGRYSNLREAVSTIKQAVTSWQNSMNEMARHLKILDVRAALSPYMPDRTSGEAYTAVDSALRAIDSLQGWHQLKILEDEIEKLGTSKFWLWYKSISLGTRRIPSVAQFAFWSGHLSGQMTGEELGKFHRARLDENLNQFRKLDQRVSNDFLPEVEREIYIMRGQLPRGERGGSPKRFTQMALIEHELRKQRMHLPVRRLLHQGGEALQAMMPCWMLGPQAVAQFLEPGKIQFDLLIIDEASQVRPEDALGSLARAKQIVIVGDSKQMPPTDVFHAIGAEDVEDDDSTGDSASIQSTALELPSVLDVFAPQLVSETLRWHYRSKHQSLISFSNENFYDSQLIVPPSRWHDSPSLGVKYHYIADGRLQSSTNPAEADEVVKLMAEQVRRWTGDDVNEMESLGVVAMNSKQQELIQEKWEQLCKRHTELDGAQKVFEDSEPLFIRNLENVQGDERDVIIISTTYGRSGADGQMYQRFGPVNREGGWKRLNVLFTRAKRRVHLVTSMKHHDVRESLSGTESGRGYLRKYLQFAETGHLPDTGTGAVKGEPDSPFEVSVAKALQGLGLDFHFQVGVQGFFIDIGVLHPSRPGEYLCGIECDGAAFHSHPISRDRDRIRQSILEGRGWKIYRIWSTDWWRARDGEMTRLREFLDSRIRSVDSIDSRRSS